MKPYYKRLPEIRGNEANLINTSVAIFLVTVSIATTKQSPVIAFLINVGSLSGILVLVEAIRRIFLAIEEIEYVDSRYDNHFQPLKNLLQSSPALKITFLVSILSSVIAYYKTDELPWMLWYSQGPIPVVSSLLGILLLGRVLDLSAGLINDSLWISNSNGLDYGSGMAHSFFHGYLKLIIPKTGTSEKNLEELMRDYEDSHQVTLESYKLFILIPKSLYCPVSLKDVSPSIEDSRSLTEKQMTVAGVKNRSYKNSVYKIVGSDRTRTYVAAEYATPLKTITDVINHNGQHSNVYKQQKNELVLQFYLTLQQDLNEHKSCADFCELVFYDDVKQQHPDGKTEYYDVGEILLNRLKEIKNRSRNSRLPVKSTSYKWTSLIFTVGLCLAAIAILLGGFYISKKGLYEM